MKALFEIKEKDRESGICDVYFNGRLLGEASVGNNTIELSDFYKMETLNFLDFDCALLPDCLDLRAEDTTIRLPYWDGFLFTQRKGNKIEFSFYAGFELDYEDENSPHLTMLLNPIQVLFRAAAKAPEFGFKKMNDDMDYLYDENALSFKYVVNATGNLAVHYQQGLKNLRALFDETMEEMREMVGYRLK